jgi:hypothetical protein
MKLLTRQSGHADVSPHRYFFDLHYSVLESRERVENTIRIAKTLSDIRDLIKAISEQGERVLAAERDRDELYSEEEERKLVSNFLDAENAICNLILAFEKIEDSAVCDSKLVGRNEKRVVDGCKRAVDLLKDLFLITQSIRWEVMQRVEGIDEVESSQSAEDFIARLQ